MTDTQAKNHTQSTAGRVGLSGSMLMAISNAPTETLQRHRLELMSEIADHAGVMRATSWGGISIEGHVRYEMASARKRLAEAELAAIAAELQRRGA